MLRWLGLAGIVGAIALSLAQPEGAVAVIGLLMLLGGIGCYIAMAVLAYQHRRVG
jgi:hypothetical protein